MSIWSFVLYTYRYGRRGPIVILSSWSWKESLSLSRPIATEDIGSYTNLESGTRVVMFGSDQGHIGNYMLAILSKRILLYLNGKWDRVRLHHLKYIYLYLDLTVSKLNKSHKDVSTRITSYLSLIYTEVQGFVSICQL